MTSSPPTGSPDLVRLVAADAWHASLTGTVETVASPDDLPWRVVRLAGTPDELRQPPLPDDILCLHRGGAKQVERKRALRRTLYDARDGALTVMPRGRPAQWRTRGPIAYTHILLSPKELDRVVVGEFAKARDQLELHDEVGLQDMLLEGMAIEMIGVAISAGDHMRLYKEALFTAVTLRLFHRGAAMVGLAGLVSPPVHGGLAGWRLRRIVEYLYENRARDIGMEELTAVVGLSRAQFFRAFKQSLGSSPGRFLEGIRLDEAKRLLERGATREKAASDGGFSSGAAMALSFRRRLGVSPSDYRRWYR